MEKNLDAPIIVSACLAGMMTNYLGESFSHPAVEKLVKDGKAIPVCPEQLGGLTTPRRPAERIGDRVVTDNGIDVSQQFRNGAREVARLVELTGARIVILKSKSPSCGVGWTYDGTFTDKIIEGDGVTAERLRSMGVKLLTEEDL
jgi:uncharacterized protein YbbK (DUF523 family)